MIGILATQTDRRFDAELSRTYALGRAGGFAALDDALELLATGGGARDRRAATPLVLVGAIDSYLESGAALCAGCRGAPQDRRGRRRIRPRRRGGLPVAGAGRRRRAQRPAADRAHRRRRPRARGGTPVQRRAVPRRRAGCGIQRVVRAHRQAASGDIACVYAGLNGESFWAKEWGVAQIRCAGHLRHRLRVQHPADCFGDAGAALGLIMLGLGALDLSRGRIDGDCLVWGGADRGERGAALLSR